MTLRRFGVFCLALAIFTSWVAASAAQERSPAARGFIWRIEKGGQTGWLVGSLHMLTPDAYPLPASMTAAFERADTLMEEADPEELASPQFAASLLPRALYLDGQTLDQRLSPATWRLIAERATAAGLPIEVIRRMKPWMAATTLQALELQRGGFDPTLGLDVHFHRLSKNASKKFVPLETSLEQITYLENLGPQFEEGLIRENLQSAQTEVTEVRTIAAAWRSGDSALLERIMLGSLNDSPEMYQSLIVMRNKAWMPKIQACIDTSRCFVVVGAGHLVGPDGLLASLRSGGYGVRQE